MYNLTQDQIDSIIAEINKLSGETWWEKQGKKFTDLWEEIKR